MNTEIALEIVKICQGFIDWGNPEKESDKQALVSKLSAALAHERSEKSQAQQEPSPVEPSAWYICTRAGEHWSTLESDRRLAQEYIDKPDIYYVAEYYDHPSSYQSQAQQTESRYTSAWKHSCAALLTDGVELWVDRCPHCGKPKPLPPAP